MALSNLGEKLDFRIRQGTTYGPLQGFLTNPDDTPIDLTGATLRGQVGDDVIAVTIVDAITGEFSFELSAADTVLVASLIPWNLEMEDSAGRVLPLIYGFVQVVTQGQSCLL